MQLHLLVYKIVSLRIVCGNYEDTASIRTKLEAETHNRILRLKDLESKSELEVAQTLCDLYQEKVNSLPAGTMPVSRPVRPERILLAL